MVNSQIQMGGAGAEPGAAPMGRVKASGREGEIIQHDPADKDMTYKLHFSDGQMPEVDWFSLEKVEVLAAAGSLPKTSAGKAEAPQKPALPQWAASRPAGTPVRDEHFICMGSKAPICPPPAGAAATWAPPAGTPMVDESFICMGSKAPPCPPPRVGQANGPITLEVLQGEWLGSGGASVAVTGTDVYMNGMLLKDHKVTLRDDGTVSSIGRIWQLDRWAPGGCGGIEFRASSTREGMESARLEVWSRKSSVGSGWSEKMRLMGYAGSSADPLGRGVEGCMPGTAGIEKGVGFNQAKDAEEVALLSSLISQWREPGTNRVISRQVVPDATNRAQTGLGVELMHYIAQSMEEKGFQKRAGLHGHDIPIVVREPPSSATHKEALDLWRKRVGEEEGFPPIRAREGEEIFTSLGNGHFFQALNLFACQSEAINRPGHHFAVGQDAALADAIAEGVPGVVLRHEVPRPVRAKIAALLNSKREFMWALNEDGSVNTESMEENTGYCSQFEWLSKGMDAVQVDCLVRTHLGIRDSKRILG
uniref:Uncharacterized protein n=1 Tax=Alexandrium catenella TaxID=2925 RepID=A0A7S1S906_ALECA